MYATADGLTSLRPTRRGGAEADATPGGETAEDPEDYSVTRPEIAAAEAYERRVAALAVSQTIREIMGGDSGFGSSPWLGDNQDDSLVDAFMGHYG